jgi:hypothetical protein
MRCVKSMNINIELTANEKSKNFSATEIRTRIAGFRVRRTIHYTTEPRCGWRDCWAL